MAADMGAVASSSSASLRNCDTRDALRPSSSRLSVVRALFTEPRARRARTAAGHVRRLCSAAPGRSYVRHRRERRSRLIARSREHSRFRRRNMRRAIFEWHDSRAHLVERTTVELPEAPDGVDHRLRRRQRHPLLALLQRARRLSRLRDEHRRTRVEAVANRSAVRPAVHCDDQRRRSEHRWRWELAEDGINFTVDFDLTYRRVSPR